MGLEQLIWGEMGAQTGISHAKLSNLQQISMGDTHFEKSLSYNIVLAQEVHST